MEIFPTADELRERDSVLRNILLAIRTGRVIKLPDFDRANPESGSRFALAAMGESASPYAGTISDYRYQFEGEEDLLHLFVYRTDGNLISVEEAQQVTGFLYGPVPKALIWLKPGNYSQHFYLGHDELLTYLKEY